MAQQKTEERKNFEPVTLLAGLIAAAGAIAALLMAQSDFAVLQWVGWGVILMSFVEFGASIGYHRWPKTRVLIIAVFVCASALVISAMACGGALRGLVAAAIIVIGCAYVARYNLWVKHLSWLFNIPVGLAILVIGIVYATGAVDLATALCASALLMGVSDVALAFMEPKR